VSGSGYGCSDLNLTEPYRRLAWEWRALTTCWYLRWTRSKCGVNLVSERVPDVDHGAGMAGCRPVDYTFVKPSCDWAFDKPRIFIVFLIICRLMRNYCRRQSSCQRLPSARCLDHLVDRIDCHLGMFAFPQQARMGCSLYDAMNAIRRESGEFSVDLGPDSPRLVVWGGRAYYDQWD
jgi:hypothetical protein